MFTPRHKNKGFASMSLEKRREVSSKGGRNAHANGTAFEYNSELASIAGKKSQANRKKRKGEAGV